MELANLEQWTRDHEEKDSQRFEAINVKLESQASGILRWFGLGGFVLLVSMAVAWGSITTQVQSHSEQLKTTLDSKDLTHINQQINAQTDAIMELKGDIRILINKIK